MIALFALCSLASVALPPDTTFRPNHYSFEVATTFYSRATVIRVEGNQSFQSRPAVSARVGFLYSRFWMNGLGFSLGIRWGITPFSYKWSMPGEAVSPYIKGDVNDRVSFYDINYWQFPLMVNYQVTLKPTWSAKLSVGASFDMLLDGSISSGYIISRTGTLPPERIFQSNLYVNNQRAFYISLPIEITVSKLWKEKHALDIGFVTSIAFRPMAIGDYVFFPERNTFSYGTLSVSNTYAAIKIGYTFQQRKKPKTNIPQRLG